MDQLYTEEAFDTKTCFLVKLFHHSGVNNVFFHESLMLLTNFPPCNGVGTPTSIHSNNEEEGSFNPYP